MSGTASSLFTTDRYNYDHAGRETQKYHRINNGTEQLVSSKTYTKVDQLASKTLGTGIQTIQYKYNIVGWLTDINDVDVCNSSLFRMKLHYDTPNANINAGAYRNGNISSIEWRSGHSCTVNGTSRNKALYGFQYDALNRLTQATYGEITGTTNPGRYNESLSYNLNGDILSLNRWGKNGGTHSAPTFGQIDQLSYSYTTSGGYRLMSVTDNVNISFGFTTTGSTQQLYTHDSNGNLTGRTNSPYNTITYNHLNLPHTISGTGGERGCSSHTKWLVAEVKRSYRPATRCNIGRGAISGVKTLCATAKVLLREITNTYDASGRKWQSTVGGVTTTYFGDIEYEGNAIKMIYGEDCRIERLSNGSYEYQYYIKDHLGNVRVVFKSGPTLISEHHYYPFGLAQEGNFYTSGTNQKYRYNGKELYGAGLGWYDYGARYYDACIGRFTGVDPLAHVQPDKTPYHFVSNNPINRIDPTGMLDEWVEKDGQMMYDNRVTNQEDATALYGEGATYRPNGYTYTASNGANIELGDYGFFKSNGQINSSPDLAQNSLAYTNPTQSMANAQSQIAGVRGNYTASAGVVGFISADVAIPEPTDAAWPKWAAYAVAGGIAAYYVAKMEGEIEGIMRRAGGPQGAQYSLQATSSGSYPCYTCGSGTMNLGVGGVWKYGETTNPAGRYTSGQLSGWGVRQVNEFYGNQVQIKVMEKTKIYGYFLQNGHLPPGNKIFR